MVKGLSDLLHSRLVGWHMDEHLDQHGLAGRHLRRCKEAAFHLIPIRLGVRPAKQCPHRCETPAAAIPTAARTRSRLRAGS